MSEEDKHFIKRYEELLDKGYCDCNEMNCIDNNSPRRILKIVKELDNINEKLSLALESAENKLEKRDNIIKEVREYITYARTPRTIYESGYGKGTCVEICMEHLLEILDKVGSDKE